MAIDTLMAYVGIYDNVADAEADYELVKDLHTDAGLIDAYDAAVIERRDGGKTKIVKKHETPTRVGGVLGGGVGLATGLVVALFPFAAIGGGLLAGATAGGAVLGAVSGPRGGRDEPPRSQGARRAPRRRARPVSWSSPSRTWAPRSSWRWSARRSSSSGSSRPTRGRSNATPSPPGRS